MRRPSALLVSLLCLTACAGPSRRTQEVDWFKGGYYAGAMVGQAILSTSESEIDGHLQNKGHMSDTDLDKSDFAWSVFGGYRFEDPYAIEVAALNLGQVESSIGGTTGSVEDLVKDVSKLHPYLGKGVSVTGRWFLVETDRAELALAGGVWIWAADFEVQSATGEKASLYSDGIDLTFGLTGTIALSDRLDLRVAWDRLYLDSDPADVLWIGLQGGLNFGRSKRMGVN